MTSCSIEPALEGYLGSPPSLQAEGNPLLEECADAAAVAALSQKSYSPAEYETNDWVKPRTRMAQMRPGLG